jgi:hypothetical protein
MLRSASPRADIRGEDQLIAGGKGSGINAQYPFGVRKTRPGDELEKLVGSIRVKSANKDIFCCHFIPKVQIKQSVICTLLTLDHIWDRDVCLVHRWTQVSIFQKSLDKSDFAGIIWVTITNAL